MYTQIFQVKNINYITMGALFLKLLKPSAYFNGSIFKMNSYKVWQQILLFYEWKQVNYKASLSRY